MGENAGDGGVMPTLQHNDIVSQIYFVRGQRVMLAQSLAVLYEVEPRVLMQAVKRNAARFPEDFMFQLSAGEFENLKSQFVISSWGGLRVLPHAFTEQGVAMLSGVLRSDRAIAVNIEIMRAFVQLRGLLESNQGLARQLADLEKKYDAQFAVVFDAIKPGYFINSRDDRAGFCFIGEFCEGAA